jgi:DNA-binding MarR family transcriptional regulator
MTTSGHPDSGAPASLDAETVAQLRRAVLVLARRLRKHLADTELSATEAAVLGRVYRDGPSTPGSLARAEHVQPPSMSRVIERLEQHGYLERTPHPTDGRQVLITGTARGQQFIEESRSLRDAWLTAHLNQLDEADRAAVQAAAAALARLAAMP